MKSPFKFLNAYTIADRDVFFGREQELVMLHRMLQKTPLLLLYGLSGTGKTSLIQCGLAGLFDGPDWLPVWIKRQSNLNDSLEQTIDKLLPERQEGAVADKVRSLYRHYLRPLYLIFDQFEELFILGDSDEQQFFARTLKELVQAGTPCTVLLVIREEYLGRLYPLEREVPALFDYRMRVEPMNVPKVTELLQKSFRTFNIEVEPPAEERYAEIIRNVSKGRSGIDLPYLQVYLDVLYREDYARTEKEETLVVNDKGMPALTFTRSEIEQFGDIDGVLDKFQTEQTQNIRRELQDRFPGAPADTVPLILDAFVSEEGTKRPFPYARQGNLILIPGESQRLLSAVDPAILTFCIEALEKARILRLDGQSIELAHDSLAALIDRRRTEDQRRRSAVKRSIENAFREWKEKRGSFLTRKQLKVFDNQSPVPDLTPELKDYIKKSRNWRLRMQWLRRGVIATIAVLLLALTALGYQISQKNIVAALIGQARLEAGTDPTIAQRTLRKALSISPNNASILEAWAEIYNNGEFYENSLYHPAAVKGVVFTPSFSSLAGADPNSRPDICTWTEQTFYRWNWSGILQDSLPVEGLRAVAFSPDGQQLAVGTSEGNLRLFHTASLALAQPEVKCHDGAITHLVFSKDGETLYSAGTNSLIRIPATNDLSDFKKILQLEDEITAISPGSSNNILLIGYSTGKTQIYDSHSESLSNLEQRHKDQVLSFAVSPAGDAWVSAGRDAQIIFWDKKGNPLLTLKGHDRRINRVDWSPDGGRLFSAGNDNQVKCWSPEGDFITAYKGHTGFVNDVALTPDGQYLASAGEDGVLRLWKVESKVIRHFGPHPNGVSGIAMSENSKYILTGSDGSLNDLRETRNDPGVKEKNIDYNNLPPEPRSAFLWDAATGARITEFKGHRGCINAVALNADGTFILTASDDRTLIGWNEKGDTLAFFSQGHYDRISSVALLFDGSLVLSGSYDGLALLWDHNGNIIKRLQHPDVVSSVAFSHDGRMFLTGCYDGTTRLFDLEGNLLDSLYQGESRRINAVSFSPDDRYILAGAWGSIADLYQIKDKKAKFIDRVEVNSKNKTGGSVINAVAFSPDNRFVCLGAEGGLAQIFRITSAGLVPERTLQHYPRRSVLSVCFTPDGKGVLTGCSDGWGRWWDLDF